MPEIEIRPAAEADLPALLALDGAYTSESAWQLEVDQNLGVGQVTAQLRQARLPRPVSVAYPRSAEQLAVELGRRDGLLAALLGGLVIGFAALDLARSPGLAWVTDLVVAPQLRRRGIGTGLVLAALEWAAAMECYALVLELQPKNEPALGLVQKLGFDFCGYHDLYYGSHGSGIFFRKAV
ncbi:MAG: GNAT family N-acetyltransferase [Chloroflexota bacterium]